MDNPLLPLQLLLTVAASFLIGLELEGRKAGGKSFSPGGVRTVPLVSLAGFLLAVLGQGQTLAFIAGLVILGGWLALLYRTKTLHGNYGMTTETYMLVAYILGGLVAAEAWWLVAALTVLMVLLQELKEPLEGLIRRLSEDELITVAKFVLLSAVILPLMPDEGYTQFALNPRRIWLIVVAASGISYAGYQLQRLLGRGGQAWLLTGLLGGAYSSTVATVAMARQSRRESAPRRIVLGGAVLAANGVMNLRLLLLIALFDQALAEQLVWPLMIPTVVGVLAGAGMCLLPSPAEATDDPAQTGRSLQQFGSPLELRTALAFAAVFVVVLIVTRQAQVWLGGQGLLAIGMISGLGVIDPFVLSLTQLADVSVGALVLAVVVAISANHLAKGVYALAVGERRTGILALSLLVALAAVTMAGWAILLAGGVIAAP